MAQLLDRSMISILYVCRGFPKHVLAVESVKESE